jgi:predicted GNAT family acetyltransferase
MAADPDVTQNAELNRFEISVEGEVAGFSTYRDIGGRRVFRHTEIEPRFEGRGLGGRLVREALDQTRAAGLRVEPLCPFVHEFIEQHPEYADLVGAESTRSSAEE